MLRVRPGVLLVRASFAPTSELIRLDLPTFERPRKAISGTLGAGKCVRSLADSMNRARIRIEIVSSVWVASGKRRRKNKFAEKFAENPDPNPARRCQCLVSEHRFVSGHRSSDAEGAPKSDAPSGAGFAAGSQSPGGRMRTLKPKRAFGMHIVCLDWMQFVPKRKRSRDDQSNENADQKEPAISR